MQPELKARIQTAAEANNRSMNAEIVHRLEASFTDGCPAGDVHHGGANMTATSAFTATATYVSADEIAEAVVKKLKETE